MFLDESILAYRSLCDKISSFDKKIIDKICKDLCLPQKTISISFYLFYAAKDKIPIEPDDIVLIASCINLSCKMCETHRRLEVIFEAACRYYSVVTEKSIIDQYFDCIGKTEIEISLILDFDYRMSEIYIKLSAICSATEENVEFITKSWIVLNDLMITPLCIYFTIPELLSAALFMTYLFELKKENKKFRDLKELFKSFTESHYIECDSFPIISYLTNEMANIYTFHINNSRSQNK